MGRGAGSVLARYDAMREAALADAQDRLIARIGVPMRLAPIDDAALQAWRAQWTARSDRPGGWDWRAQRQGLRSTLDRFEVALWSETILCGLAIGKPSDGPSHLTVRLLEGNPADSHPLKGCVAECVVEASISYARLLDKKQLRLHRPLPGALPTYRRLGFAVVSDQSAAPYCLLEI